MSAPVATVLVVGGEVEATLPGGALPPLEEGALALRSLRHAHHLETLQASLLGAEPPPAAVVLTPAVRNPLAVARKIHQIAPLLQMLIIVPPEHLEEFRKATTFAPRLGDHWSLIGAGDARLPDLIRAAAHDTLKRTGLRAQYDRMNAKMRQQVVDDSETQRGLVVSNQYLASIVEHATDAILAIDGHDAIATWNQGAQEMFGLERQHALGQSVGILVEDALAPTLISLVEAARSGEVLRSQELECRHAGGEHFHAEFTLAPVRDEAGRTTSVSVTARDVTQRRRHAAEVAALNRSLERRVRELRHANASLVSALSELEATKRELEALNATLERQATTDALTGLKNRMVFQNSLVEMVAVAQRQQGQLSVLVIDIDHFKRINDTHGHQQGDRVLQSIAAALAAHTREQDVAARYGGEEFAILLPNTSLTEAVTVAEKLRRACAGLGSIGLGGAAVGGATVGGATAGGAEFGGGAHRLTVSIGAATLQAGESATSLIGRADEALYASKARGRNCVTAAGADMTEAAPTS